MNGPEREKMIDLREKDRRKTRRLFSGDEILVNQIELLTKGIEFFLDIRDNYNQNQRLDLRLSTKSHFYYWKEYNWKTPLSRTLYWIRPI